MPRKRTSITLDAALVARASKVLKIESASDVIEYCLKETLRSHSLNDLADLVQTAVVPIEPSVTTPSRKRSA
jgi:Arc/MetJ family transcription regulator